jgi:hypothetical protein
VCRRRGPMPPALAAPCWHKHLKHSTRGRTRSLCFVLPADGSGSDSRKSTEIGISVRTSVHLRRQRNRSSTHNTPMRCFSLPSYMRVAALASKLTGMTAVHNVMLNLTHVELKDRNVFDVVKDLVGLVEYAHNWRNWTHPPMIMEAKDLSENDKHNKPTE